MEWLWAAISVCWTIGAWVVARAVWAMAQSWSASGMVDSGLVGGLSRDANPVGFAVARGAALLVAGLALLFVAIGIAITLGWISRAL